MKAKGILALALLTPSSHGFSPLPLRAPLPPPPVRRARPRAPYRAAPLATRLRSVPTPLDTATSGLASVARLPRGTTVAGGISATGPATAFLPTLTTLYDVENDRDCRRVREKITEYDLNVGRVVPAAPNSRAVAAAPVVAPTLVAAVDGRATSFAGADAILAFLEEKFATERGAATETPTEAEGGEDGEDGGDAARRVRAQTSDLASYLPGVLRAGRGVRVCGAAAPALSPPRPARPLILYSYEGNQFCRLVREVLTELDLEYELRSAGKGSPRREELAKLTGGSSQCPYLIDDNTGRSLPESGAIAEYLYANYALWTPPSELLRAASGFLTPLLAPVYKLTAPLQAGSSRENEFEYASEIAEAKADIYDEISSRPVVIYTYEYSPFCSEAVALLKSAGIAYKEISNGREWIPGLIAAPAKRAALLDLTGQSSLPHVFVGGESVGGLFSGSPGLVPALEEGTLLDMVAEAQREM